MADDENWHVLPNGLRVNGISRPRIVDGVDTYTGERLAPEDPTPEEAEAQSVEHRRQRTASFFRQPKWTVDLVVSWIGYRDPAAIDVPFKPDIWKHSRPAICTQPRLTLLHALQSGDLRAIRHRQDLAGRLSLEEWLNVNDQWSVDLWPECVFARVEVIAVWPESPAAPASPIIAPGPRAQGRTESTPGPRPVKFEKTKAAMLHDLRGGGLAAGEKQEALAKRYSVGRGVAANAYRAALSEFLTPTNTDTK